MCTYRFLENVESKKQTIEKKLVLHSEIFTEWKRKIFSIVHVASLFKTEHNQINETPIINIFSFRSGHR